MRDPLPLFGTMRVPDGLTAVQFAIPASGAARPTAWAPLRIHLTYLWRHHRLLDLAQPTTFNELVQRRKLNDRNLQLAVLSDKLMVKPYVVDRLGSEWVTPTLWHGTALPATPPWPQPFVVKSRHGCNHTAFVRSDADDWSSVRRRARRWMRREYGFWLDEWLYSQIPRGLLVEPFIGTGGVLPIDYKLFVFHGHVEFIQVHLQRETRHRWIVFDRAWQRVSSRTADADPPCPHSLPALIEAAETLSIGFDFVRVDMYEIDRTPLFGEMTFYPGSGLDRFDPVSLDAVMGACWLGPRSVVDRNDTDLESPA